MLTLARTSVADEPPRAVWDRPISTAYAVRFSNGSEETHGEAPPAFTLAVRDGAHMQNLLGSDAYSAALSFVRGEFDVVGNLVAAVHMFRSQARRGWRALLYALAARVAPHRIEAVFQTRARAAQNIRYHYDRSNDFYRQFLDQRMVYSCGYFRTPETPLDDAQAAKLNHICRKLDLHAGDRLLDIGCGWGALLIHAAAQFGVRATGCTLSKNQVAYATEAARLHAPDAQVAVHEMDFRDITGRFDKVASVGMFEHVGRRRLHRYFRAVHNLLEEDGLFLNHGIVRPAFVRDDAQTLFGQRHVFPGGELAHLSDVVRTAELTGFEVLDVEDLRPHYALTCRAWVERLQHNATACLEVVDSTTYRTWLLYLAGAAAGFEDGFISVSQLLLAKRSSPRRRLTRRYVYCDEAAPTCPPDPDEADRAERHARTPSGI